MKWFWGKEKSLIERGKREELQVMALNKYVTAETCLCLKQSLHNTRNDPQQHGSSGGSMVRLNPMECAIEQSVWFLYTVRFLVIL